MRVKINIRDKDLELVNVKEYDFRDFCDLLSRRITSCLYMVEDCLDPLSPVQFKDIRSNILDVAGEVRRLPRDIQFPKDVI